MKREHQINFWYVAVALIGVVLIQSYWAQLQTIRHIRTLIGRETLSDGMLANFAKRVDKAPPTANVAA